MESKEPEDICPNTNDRWDVRRDLPEEQILDVKEEIDDIEGEFDDI